MRIKPLYPAQLSTPLTGRLCPGGMRGSCLVLVVVVVVVVQPPARQQSGGSASGLQESWTKREGAEAPSQFAPIQPAFLTRPASFALSAPASAAPARCA